MAKTTIDSLHVRDAVSKTFHITPEGIILHIDTNDRPIIVPEKYRKTIMKMMETAEKYADEITFIKDVNVHGDTEELGKMAQKIWEELITQ